jgi:hypothetical protein
MLPKSARLPDCITERAADYGSSVGSYDYHGVARGNRKLPE